MVGDELRITLDGARARAELRRAGSGGWSLERAGTPDDSLREILTAAPIHRGKLRLILEPPLVQYRRVEEIPPVRDEDLNLLVQRNTARFFRQNGHPLISTASRIVDDEGRSVVEMAAAEQDLVLQLIATAEALSARPVEVAPARNQSQSLSLLPKELRTRQERAAWTKLALAAMAVAVLWAGGFALLFARAVRASDEVARQLRQLEPSRQALAAARSAIDSATRMVAALDAAEPERGSLVNALARLPVLLPDSVVLTRLSLDRSGSLSLTGHASRLSGVLVRLSEVAGPKARVVPGPVTDSGGLHLESFTLTDGQAPK